MKLLIASALLSTGYSVAQLARSQVSEVSNERAEDAHAADTTVTVAVAVTGSTGHMLESNDYNIVGSKLKPDLDVGILSNKQDTNSRRLAPECAGGFVNCIDGNDSVSGNNTCAEACGEACCVGPNACDYFTGDVCMDDVSCFGYKSCYYAKIDTIVHGCNGTYACYKAAYDGGFIGEVYNSCLGNTTCSEAARYGGSITEIVNGCHGVQACEYAAESDGKIDGIQDSCVGYKACYSAAYNGGSTANISNSCNDISSCFYTAAYGGTIGDILNSCDDTDACSHAGACKNTTEPEQCASNITEILDSCVGEEACVRVAFDGRIVEGIDNACNNVMACFEAGLEGDISTGIKDCCNMEDECANITEATLPDECVMASSSAPTESTPMPSQFPSSAPSTSNEPSPMPSGFPSTMPSELPSFEPSKEPSPMPSEFPTATTVPSKSPTAAPSKIPTAAPSKSPTAAPRTTKQPTAKPSMSPIVQGVPAGKAGKTKTGKSATISKAAKRTFTTIKRTRGHAADAASHLSDKLPFTSGSDEQRT